MDLPKGIKRRKNGMYEYRKCMNGERKSFYSFDLDELLDLIVIKEELKKDSSVEKVAELLIDKEEQYVYFITDGSYCKIGVATNIEQRLKQLQTGNPNELKVLHSIKTKCPYELEKALHSVFGMKRVRYEWFDILDCVKNTMLST